jgi:hypothetical protein
MSAVFTLYHPGPFFFFFSFSRCCPWSLYIHFLSPTYAREAAAAPPLWTRGACCGCWLVQGATFGTMHCAAARAWRMRLQPRRVGWAARVRRRCGRCWDARCACARGTAAKCARRGTSLTEWMPRTRSGIRAVLRSSFIRAGRAGGKGFFSSSFFNVPVRWHPF